MWSNYVIKCYTTSVTRFPQIGVEIVQRVWVKNHYILLKKFPYRRGKFGPKKESKCEERKVRSV